MSLDDKREPIEENDLPDCLARWQARDFRKDVDRASKAFFVSVEEIRKANYDLSLNRYKTTDFQQQAFEPPRVILARMNLLNEQIAVDLAELDEVLR